jgi:pimeloyl-ACP methyl ester carboxylesterase
MGDRPIPGPADRRGIQMSHQMLELPGGPLEVWRSGMGPTVLVAHGLGFGGSYRNNTWLAQELPNHQVISLSRPGYGETPLSTATTFHDQAAMYIDVLDAVGVDECVVVGISASGPIALLAARDHAPRIRGLVLWCAAARALPSHFIEEAEGNADVDFLEAEQAAQRAVYAKVLSDESFAQAALPEELRPAEMQRYAHDPLVRANIRTHLEAQLVAPPAVAGVRNDLLQLRALLSEGVDSRVHVPMLVIHGGDDDGVPVAHAQYYASVNPSAELDIIEGAGHGFMHTFRPEVILRLRAFLDRNRPAPGAATQ